MSASIQSNIQRIELVTEYVLDGEPERTVQDLAVQFLSDDTAVVMASSGIVEDFRLLFGDAIVVSPRADGSYDLVGVQHPSPSFRKRPFIASEVHGNQSGRPGSPMFRPRTTAPSVRRPVWYFTLQRKSSADSQVSCWISHRNFGSDQKPQRELLPRKTKAPLGEAGLSDGQSGEGSEAVSSVGGSA